MLAEPPRNGEYLVAAYVVATLILVGYWMRLWQKARRVFSGQWLGHVVYWVGPIGGAILAALLWQYILLPKAPMPRRRKTD